MFVLAQAQGLTHEAQAGDGKSRLTEVSFGKELPPLIDDADFIARRLCSKIFFGESNDQTGRFDRLQANQSPYP